MSSFDQTPPWNDHVPDERRSLIAGLICGGLAVLLAVAMLSLSARVGRMAFPLAYDDIAYVLGGFEVYQTLLAGHKLEALSQMLRGHAPLQTALAALAHFVFGFHEWAVYAINTGLVLALIAAVLWIVRPLRLLPQIAIAVVVLCTPVTANLVTEFRPDLMWGFLCGFAAYLIFDPRFLRGSFTYQVSTAIVSALALLGKPSGVPATAIFFAYAATASFALVLKEERNVRRSTKRYWRRFSLFLAAVALLVAPYYLQNIKALYDYIRTTFIEQIDIYATPGDWLYQLNFYAFGLAYTVTLYLTLWLGLIVFLINVGLFVKARNLPALLRYLAYAAAVFAAYSAPTISPVKSYYLGGIFYGTFLFFTVHGLVLVFQALQSYSLPTARTAAMVLLALSLYSYQPNPLFIQIGVQDATDRRGINDHVVAELAREVRRMPPEPIPIVFIPAPDPITVEYLTLRLGWRGLKIKTTAGYYLRTMQKQEELLRDSNFVVLTETLSTNYPGQRFTPDLIKAVSSDPSFVKVVDFADSQGRHTYLFERVANNR